jgi:hypothetical protein
MYGSALLDQNKTQELKVPRNAFVGSVVTISICGC